MRPVERSSLLEVEAGDAVDIIQDLVAGGLSIVEDDIDRDDVGVVDAVAAVGVPVVLQRDGPDLAVAAVGEPGGAVLGAVGQVVDEYVEVRDLLLVFVDDFVEMKGYR